MYAFIEKFLADILVDAGLMENYNTYSVTEGEVAIIDRDAFEKVLTALQSIAPLYNYDQNCIEIVSSDVVGMRTILHPFWLNDLLFDSITPGQAKELPQYLMIKKIKESPSSRFNKQDFIDKFKTFLMSAQKEIRAQETELSAALENPAEAEAKHIQVEEEDSIYKQIKNELSEFNISLHKDGEYFIQDNSDVFSLYSLKYFALKTKKNVICINKNLCGVSNIINKKLEELKINNTTVVIFVYPALSKFVQGPEMVHTLFGFDFKELRQLHYEGPSRSTHSNKSHPMGIAFSEFDYVYRDFKTGIVWALQKKNQIFFMIDKMDQLNNKFLEIIIKELADRYMGSLPYEEMLKRDIKYFEEITKNDKSRFVELGVLSSKDLINSLRNEYEEMKEKYSEALNNALEYGRIAQKLEEALVSFNEEETAKKEAERCEKIFDELRSIPKIMAVRVIGKNVHIYTKNIYVKHEKNGTWHDIGTFHIVIGMFSDRYDSNNTIKIYNTKHQIHAFNELMQAPHVFDNGHICHGNIIGMMTDAYKRRDLFQMVTIIILFLENVNLDDPAGAYLCRWPVVSEEKAKNSDVIDEFEKIFEEKNELEKKFNDKLDIPIHIGG